MQSRARSAHWWTSRTGKRRKLLGWSVAALAKKSNRTIISVFWAESEIDQADRAGVLYDIEATLESAGIEFVDGEKPGVRLRNGL